MFILFSISAGVKLMFEIDPIGVKFEIFSQDAPTEDTDISST